MTDDMNRGLDANEPVSRKCRLAEWSFVLSMIFPCAIALICILGGRFHEPLRILCLIVEAGFFLLPVGFLLGIAALIQIRRNRDTLRGHVYAIAGILIPVIVPVLMIFRFVHVRSEEDHVVGCYSNMDCISLGLRSYKLDHNGYLPPPSKWNDALYPYTKDRSLLLCPAARVDEPTYALNAALIGKHLDRIKRPNLTVLLFDSIPGRNLVGGPELVPIKPRHHETYHAVFVDRHREECDRARLVRLLKQNVSEETMR